MFYKRKSGIGWKRMVCLRNPAIQVSIWTSERNGSNIAALKRFLIPYIGETDRWEYFLTKEPFQILFSLSQLNQQLAGQPPPDLEVPKLELSAEDVSSFFMAHGGKGSCCVQNAAFEIPLIFISKFLGICFLLLCELWVEWCDLEFYEHLSILLAPCFYIIIRTISDIPFHQYPTLLPLF